jgi:hypothetical protein
MRIEPVTEVPNRLRRAIVEMRVVAKNFNALDSGTGRISDQPKRQRLADEPVG